jgi:predicted RNase H-like HicB family nuclease
MEIEDKVSNEIKLNAVFKRDEISGYYEIYYLGFPNFIGYGKTEQEAELNLLGILQTALDERKEKIREQSINNYYTGPDDKIS